MIPLSGPGETESRPDWVTPPLDRVVDWVGSEVIGWLPGQQPDHLTLGVMWGHRPGRATLVFSDRRRSAARLVVKLASRQVGISHIVDEQQALQRARSELPSAIAAGVPVPLGSYSDDELVALAMTAVPGTRARLPSLTSPVGTRRDRLQLERHVRAVRAWSRRLSDSTAARPTVRLEDTATGSRLQALLNDNAVLAGVGDEIRGQFESDYLRELTWAPVWQHGDVASGNVLYHRGQVRLVDWEAAGPSHMPWRDDAYLLMSLARTAQRSLGTLSIGAAMLRTFRSEGWVGQTLRLLYEDEWSHPIPLGVAIALTALELAAKPGHELQPTSEWAGLVIDLFVDEQLRGSFGGGPSSV